MVPVSSGKCNRDCGLSLQDPSPKTEAVQNQEDIFLPTVRLAKTPTQKQIAHSGHLMDGAASFTAQ